MKTNKQTIMKRAHEMRKETGKSMAICLMQSWKVFKLAKRMSQGVVKFAYEKLDGTLRYATGTLQNLSEYINKDNLNKASTYSDYATTYKAASYFDVEARAFRSFKIQNLITIY